MKINRVKRRKKKQQQKSIECTRLCLSDEKIYQTHDDSYLLWFQKTEDSVAFVIFIGFGGIKGMR